MPASIELAKENNVNQHLTESPAVYEFALVHPARPDSRIKVYVGKAVNLKQRHNQYLSLPTSADPDANLARHFACALEHGCEVWRRYRYVEQVQHIQYVWDTAQIFVGRHASSLLALAVAAHAVNVLAQKLATQTSGGGWHVLCCDEVRVLPVAPGCV